MLSQPVLPQWMVPATTPAATETPVATPESTEAKIKGSPVVSRYGQGWSIRQGLTLCNAAGGQPVHSDFADYVETAIALGQARAALDAAKMALLIALLWNVRQFCDDFLELLGQVEAA